WEKQKGSRGIRRGQWYRLVFQFPIRELWPDIISWMIDGMTRLEKAIRPSLQELAVELKKSGLITEGGDE
ncbi:hypothetical protein R1M86_27085, partial [Klebsiella sp. 80660]